MDAILIEKRFRGLQSLIGNTPMLCIDFLYKGQKRTIYAKAEHMNMTGSIKDRMAFHILRKGYQNKALKADGLVIEATSGNTGIAFSAIGRALGHPVTIFMPDWLSQERINLIRGLGATINLVSKEQGGFLGSIAMAEELAKNTENSFLPRQFSNDHNVEAHYNTTGPEIFWQLKLRGLQPDAFIAGVGTGGTIMGTGKYLREQIPGIRLYPLEPSNSPTLTTGYKVGKHRVQGISDEFIPDILKLEHLDHVVAVDDGDSIIMAQKLARELGIGVGISSGANFLGALKVLEELGPEATVVTIFSDDNKKYLSTDLMREEPVKDGFLSSDIELLSFHSFKRNCNTCCDPEACMEDYHPDNRAEIRMPGCPLKLEV
jgi:cysteine synthase A